MSTRVYRCPDHGFVTSETCPDCGRDAESVLAGDRREPLSKFLSGALRHFPGDAGVRLDDRGWTSYDDLVAAAEDRYPWATRERVDAVVATDPKGRFERADDRIRAAYGHSVDVTLDDADEPTDPGDVPSRLYHGTAPRTVDAIMRDGLKPMNRQEVHLSATPDDARTVGRRRADDPVVLAVDAERLVRDGHRVSRRAETTYTTDRVPPEYVSVADADDADVDADADES